MNKIIKYFDLVSQYRKEGSRAVSDLEEKKLKWWPQYIALLIGILIQPYLQHYLASGKWDLNGLGGWIVASVFLALIALPAVYKSSFDATKPLFVQLCVILTAGMGWQTIIGTVLKATNVAAP